MFVKITKLPLHLFMLQSCWNRNIINILKTFFLVVSFPNNTNVHLWKRPFKQYKNLIELKKRNIRTNLIIKHFIRPHAIILQTTYNTNSTILNSFKTETLLSQK